MERDIGMFAAIQVNVQSATNQKNILIETTIGRTFILMFHDIMASIRSFK